MSQPTTLVVTASPNPAAPESTQAYLKGVVPTTHWRGWKTGETPQGHRCCGWQPGIRDGACNELRLEGCHLSDVPVGRVQGPHPSSRRGVHEYDDQFRRRLIVSTLQHLFASTDLAGCCRVRVEIVRISGTCAPKALRQTAQADATDARLQGGEMQSVLPTAGR